METYKPNIGWIFWFFLILVLAVMVVLIVTMVGTWNMMPIKYMREIIAVVLVIVLIPFFISFLVLALTLYTVDENEIRISGAFGKRNIQYSAVTKITDTNKGVINESMFVLSNERIVIFYETDKKVSISPRNKSEVLSILKEKCRSAEFEEDLKLDKAGNRAAERKPLVKETGSATVNEKPAADTEKEPSKFKFKLPGTNKEQE
jgi:hypothetical protein